MLGWFVTVLSSPLLTCSTLGPYYPLIPPPVASVFHVFVGALTPQPDSEYTYEPASQAFQLRTFQQVTIIVSVPTFQPFVALTDLLPAGTHTHRPTRRGP